MPHHHPDALLDFCCRCYFTDPVLASPGSLASVMICSKRLVNVAAAITHFAAISSYFYTVVFDARSQVLALVCFCYL